MELKRKMSPEEYKEFCRKTARGPLNLSKKAGLYEQCSFTGDYYLRSEFHSGNIFPMRRSLQLCSTIGNKYGKGK